MTCSQCNAKEIDKGTICSTCRSKNSRAKKKLDEKRVVTKKGVAQKIEPQFLNAVNAVEKLSAVDQEHEDKYPGFHIFEKESSRSCPLCKKKFTTTLSLNRFCSLACKGI